MVELVELESFITLHRPKNTKKAYNTYSKQYLVYCAEKGFPRESSISAASFMKASYDRGLTGRSTLTSIIPSAISDLFRYEGFNPCDHALVKQMKKTLKNLSKPPTSKLPLEIAHLRALAKLFQRKVVSTKFVEVRDFFMLVLMTAAMLREDEAMALKKGDVWLETIEGEICLFVFVEKSKTDQCRNGHTITIGLSSHKHTCPIHWFYAYQKSKNPRARFFFHQLDSKHKSMGLAITTPWHVIKRLLPRIGVNPKKYGSHSCRRGGVTAAVAANVELRLIANHGN